MRSALSNWKFSSSWPGRVLVVALDHVEAHLAGVLEDLVDERLQLGELVDVVAVRLGHALDGGLALGVGLEPHHLGLAADAELEPGGGGELVVNPVQVAAAVRGEEGAAVDLLLAAAEQGAEHPGDSRVPGKRTEGVDVGKPDQLARLGPVADVVAPAVDEQVGRRPVDELEPLAGDRLPVWRRHALAHDAARDRDELVVDVGDPLGVDAAPHVRDEFLATLLGDEALEIRHRYPPHNPRSDWRRLFLSSEHCMLR